MGKTRHYGGRRETCRSNKGSWERGGNHRRDSALSEIQGIMRVKEDVWDKWNNVEVTWNCGNDKALREKGRTVGESIAGVTGNCGNKGLRERQGNCKTDSELWEPEGVMGITELWKK